MRSFLLAIEGVIGVGKTTLARLLQPRFKTELLLEAFEENPFLSDFYADRERYAFQTQMFFLLSRYRQQQMLSGLLRRTPLIADYTFDKDRLFAQMTLSGDELDVYQQLYRVLADRIPAPDLVVYLRADTDLLMWRIATRDRAYERDMDRAYIESLRQAYERHFADYDHAPLLVVEADDLDYVQNPADLDFVEGQVRTALGIGAYQQPLPQMIPAGPSKLSDTRLTAPADEVDAVHTFLQANEALARVGAALAQRAEIETGTGVRAAMMDAMSRLRQLARTVGVERLEVEE
jgi:deoxyadenosine/deoxycytidine kinase